MLARSALIASLLQQLTTVIVGKDAVVRDALTCLLAGGHLLLEDVPGVGKTTLAQALARTLGLRFARVQFTADLMPSDLIGASIWDRTEGRFVFHPGPLFAQVLLADEINRASPKTQSALLEAMEERQVSVDGETHRLPQPFFVIATQNPFEQSGTQALPESQLDRFLMRLSLGFPDSAAERALLRGEDRRALLERLPALADPAALRALQQAAAEVRVADALLDALQALLQATRDGRWFVHGLSPRAGLALLRAARARAFVEGRDYVAPDDLHAVLVPVAAHRLVPAPGSGRDAAGQLRALLAELG
ncbi:Holliday junction ATP-dependent DNA helicase RuvB [Tepidimonas alkaliphilus]|uniref:Holliday junction ATP-dependent DNA helicase RuvB n=1 Tax=Tepidimonas alkaliphilus TaxID=2588942 RepID=A0A554WA47_9BURK|nr:AAA family ATPase [Tepidimonas alkaliphilus]TSE20420.1 Holliday junction ATP-dependent DNA helicase RuvB [Tepidimonas alkaliphilus]